MTSPGAVAFSIFGIDIMWYGILVGSGFILAVILSYIRAPKHGIQSDQIIDLALWLIPLSIIGARAYYVIFEWENYSGDLAKILNIRGGGLAVHGELIVGLIVALVFCRRRKIPFLELTDLIFPHVAIAQSIGRWGNFFNSEAHGTATDLPWAILVDGQYVHPTFLYESIWCFCLFWFLLWMDRRRKFRGQITLLYGMLYSVERFCVEALRTDSLMIGPFRQAQVLSACVFITCLVLYIYLNQKQRKEAELARAQSKKSNKRAKNHSKRA